MFGISDVVGETWVASEEKVITFSRDHRDITIIITILNVRTDANKAKQDKLSQSAFKLKNELLVFGSKLKETRFFISEDYSVTSNF